MPKQFSISSFICILLCLNIFISSACLLPFPTRKLKEQINQDNYTSQSAKSPKQKKGKYINNERPFADFERSILGYFEDENFAEIDKIADKARLEKERFQGGYWKISILYYALAEIYANEFVTEEMWVNHLQKLKRWKEKSPDSVTARIALAKSYKGYGWFARGTGFSNTVADEDSQKLDERLDLAVLELKEAKKLSQKCPEWYSEMLFLAMARGWKEEEFDYLLEEAIEFEPNYYYFYYAKIENSLPRWGGKKGDAENFAKRIEAINSDEKNILYYLYMTNLANYHYDDWTTCENLSWDKAKLGYKELEKKYGVDKLRLNEYAFLASTTPDSVESYNAFNKIGDNWDSEVFSEQRFYEIKAEVNRVSSESLSC